MIDGIKHLTLNSVIPIGKAGETMRSITNLQLEMTKYYSGDPKRIQHFTKVHSFAKLIGTCEQLEDSTLFLLEAAALVHDIGIKLCEEKYGNCNGKLQETEGPALAKEMLERLGFEQALIERVCYLVGHHHTYTEIDGIDYQILVEADFLVNLYEDNLPESACVTTLNKIFKTDSGRNLCRTMFLS
jgi:uncharacterized protein